MSDHLTRQLASSTAQPLNDLKRTLRLPITPAPITHAPAHGTSQFASRATRPGNRSMDYLSVVALDWYAGEEE